MVHSDFVPASRPAVPDLKSCEHWLGLAPLADSREACRAFLALFDEIEDSPPPHATYAAILERLRTPLLGALDEHARRFTGKPVPLGHAEAAAFQQSCDVWLAQLRAWRRLLRSASNRPIITSSTLRSLCARRALNACAGLIECHFAAHRQVGADLWRWLHDSFAIAAPLETDAQAAASADTATGSYGSVLLMALCQTEALGTREYAFARHCAARWGGKLALVPGTADTAGYTVDEERDGPPQWQAAAGQRLDTRALARSLKWRIRQLAEGIEPARLGLPSDAGAAFATDMLRRLVRAWTAAPRARQFPRRSGHTASESALGLANIHCVMTDGAEDAVLNGGPRSWDYSHGAAEQIHVFQRALESAARTRQGVIEAWETLDESASGFRLRRAGPGARLALHQLIALRPHGARRFILGDVRWTEVGSDGAVSAGVRALPGQAQPCMVRDIASDPKHPEPWSAAFLLPVAAGLPAALVLPTGRWGTGRTLEMRSGETIRKLVVAEVLEHGFDYDRTRFVES